MYPGVHAAVKPEHPALIVAETGECLSYGDLDRRSIQLARLFDERGLARDAVVAIGV